MSATNGAPWIVIGNYGADNTGDEAMLAGLLDGLGATPHALSIVSKRAVASAWAQEHPVSWLRPAPLRVLTALRTARGLAMAGGTHFHDDYRQPRLVHHWWYLIRIVLLSLAARLLGKQVVWLGVGVGPLRGRPTRLLTRAALSLCHRITVRDGASMEEVCRLDPEADVQVSFDLAALMQRPSIRPAPPRPRLGVSMLALADTREGSVESDRALQDAMVSAVRRLLDAEPVMDVALMTLRGGAREADVTVTRGLWEALAATHPDRVALVPYHDSPYVMFEEIARCSYMLGARYHAGMLAFLAHVPQLVIAYHRKCADLCDEVRMPPEACLSVADVVGGSLDERLLALVRSPERFLPGVTPGQASLAARRSVALLASELDGHESDSRCVA